MTCSRADILDSKGFAEYQRNDTLIFGFFVSDKEVKPMVELTGIKKSGGIYTYSYRVDPPKNAANADEGESFAACLNNAANIADKASKSEYSKEELEAQKVKNQAIGKLQKLDPDVAALERVAPNASEEVKGAWLDAAKEAGCNGLGYGSTGATRLCADLAESTRMTDNSAAGVQDLLGGTVESAIDAISAANYDREHIDSGTADPTGIEKEKAFYAAFLDKLNGLLDGSYAPSEASTFERMNKNNEEVLPGDGEGAAVPLEVGENYGERAAFHRTTGADAEGITFEVSARYPEDYDKTNSSIEVLVKYKGKENLYRVDVMSVEPEKASQAELYGLFAYIEDDKNVPRSIDPDSSDIYYSALDRKLEKIRNAANEQNDAMEMVKSFNSMDNLSYWDKKDLMMN